MTYRDISDFVGTVTSGIRLASALDLIGLERRRSTMSYMVPTISAFGVGIAVGAGLGLLFAPKPGARLRDDITKKVNRIADDMKTAAEKAETEVQARVGRATEAQPEANGH